MKNKKIYSGSYYNISNLKYKVVVYAEASSKDEAINLLSNYIIDNHSLYQKGITKVANSMYELEEEEQYLFINGFAQFEVESV